MYSLPKFSVES